MTPLAHYVGWMIGVCRAETQTTEAERDCLARHARGRRRLAEIGVWHGVTTSRLREAMAADHKRPKTIKGYVETLDKLIAVSDVLICNFPPPVRDKLKLSYENVKLATRSYK